jgi:hypothetical protein
VDRLAAAFAIDHVRRLFLGFILILQNTARIMSNIPPAGAGPPIPIKAARADMPKFTLNEANKKEEGVADADWGSERQIVTSLWRLQELEAKVRDPYFRHRKIPG